VFKNPGIPKRGIVSSRTKKGVAKKKPSQKKKKHGRKPLRKNIVGEAENTTKSLRLDAP